MAETCEIGAATRTRTTPFVAPQALACVFSFPAVMVMSLMLVLALFASNAGPGRDISDPDIWWHLENARQFLATGRFIQHDAYSFTVAGKPWINFEWLSELPFYAAYRAFSLRGIFVLSLVLGEAIVVGVFLLCYMRSRDVKASFLASGLAVFLACISLGPRALLFGWLFLVAELAILWAYQQGRNFIWALPPVFLVWINMHGSWLFGLIILLLFTACAFVRGEWGIIEAPGLPGAQRKQLLYVVAAAVWALFLNPYGWKLPLYPLEFVHNQQLNMKFVDEWASLDLHSIFGKVVLATLGSLVIGTLARKRKWTIFDLALVFFAVYSGLTYTRFIFMTGIVLAPFLAVELRGVLGPYERDLERPWLNAVVLSALAALIVWRLPSESALQQHRDETFPVEALTRLQQLPAGHVFNAYEWGGYMIHSAPQVPVFIDSRADVFVRYGIFTDYVDATKGWQSFETLKRYDIRYVLLPPNTAMSYLLAHNKDWHQEYSDTHSVLFGREMVHSRR